MTDNSVFQKFQIPNENATLISPNSKGAKIPQILNSLIQESSRYHRKGLGKAIIPVFKTLFAVVIYIIERLQSDKGITSKLPSAVFALLFFFTKFSNYRILLILDNASVNFRHQDPLPLGALWVLHFITTPPASNCISGSSLWGKDSKSWPNTFL